MTTVPISTIRKTGSEGPSGRRPSGRLSFFLCGLGSAMRGIEPRMALGSEVHVSRPKAGMPVLQGRLSYGTDRRGADLLRKPSRCRFASRGGCAFYGPHARPVRLRVRRDRLAHGTRAHGPRNGLPDRECGVSGPSRGTDGTDRQAVRVPDPKSQKGQRENWGIQLVQDYTVRGCPQGRVC